LPRDLHRLIDRPMGHESPRVKEPSAELYCSTQANDKTGTPSATLRCHDGAGRLRGFSSRLIIPWFSVFETERSHGKFQIESRHIAPY
jgi:hypothetical protein